MEMPQEVDHPAVHPERALMVAREERKEELVALLRKNGLEWRDDSSLCRLYMLLGGSTLFNDPKQIAHKMAEARYLHNYCNFELGRRIAMNTRDAREAQGGKKYNRQQFLNLLRRCVLLTTSLDRFPWKWPWLNDTPPDVWMSRFDVSKALLSRQGLEEVQFLQKKNRSEKFRRKSVRKSM